MKKKEYLKPSVSVKEIGTVEILAASQTPPTMKGSVDDVDDLEYGGDTKPGQSYTPW